jgi:ferrous iron transport protein B
MRALLGEEARCWLQVGDAKNLRRTLTLTALLAELGVPMVLTLNMHDEAAARGVTVDLAALGEELGIPVLATVATGGEGIEALTQALPQARRPDPLLHYDAASEASIGEMAAAIAELAPDPQLAARGLAILYLGNDGQVEDWLHERAGENYGQLVEIRKTAQARLPGKLPAELARERTQAAEAQLRRLKKIERALAIAASALGLAQAAMAGKPKDITQALGQLKTAISTSV